MLSGKLALVTGGASGIGFQIAKAFANEGASLCIVDVNKNIDSVLKQLPDTSAHTAFKCDVSNSNDVKNLFDNIKKQYANIIPTVIVNSAGITRDNLFLKLTEEDYDSVLNVNLKGTFLITQAASKELILNNSQVNLENFKTYASIINIGSIVGRLGNVGQANYSASKAAVEGLTKTVARELGNS